MNALGWWSLVLVAVALVLVWPRHGAFARAGRRAAARTQEHGDNALKHLFHEAQAGRAGSFASLKGTLRLQDRALLRLLERLRAGGLTATDGGRYVLTADGEQRARHLVRAHRLLERYLADEARLPVTSVHRVAERLEHTLSEEDAERLSASMGHPERDPHGDPIPWAGEASADIGTPITAWPQDEDGRITHLEDEPAATFKALVQLGLEPGQAFRVVGVTADALRLHVEGREMTLPLEHAGNVFVGAIEGADADAQGLQRLADVPAGQDAEVVSLSSTCQGLTRRRLLDLGFTPGTRLRPVLETFVGDPRAYRVRGTTIALRRDQASVVIVRPVAATGSRASEMRHQA